MHASPRPNHTPGDRALVSVVVLNFRRQQELVRTLDSVRTQTYEPRETIVVDNASGDDTLPFLSRHYPEVRAFLLPGNIGCGGRNRGVEAAQGEFVVTLDNDVRFDHPSALEEVVRGFAQHPEASVLVFKILADATGDLHLRDWCHPRNCFEWADRDFETYYIAEGACAFRRASFLGVGGYYEPFHIGGEGWDLALRMIEAGHRVVYCAGVRVRHALAQETRGDRRPYYFLTRNAIWTAFRDYRGWRRWQYVAYTIARVLFFARSWAILRDFFQGLRDGFRQARHLPGRPVSDATWKRIREIRSRRPGWLTRLRTHAGHSEI